MGECDGQLRNQFEKKWYVCVCARELEHVHVVCMYLVDATCMVCFCTFIGICCVYIVFIPDVHIVLCMSVCMYAIGRLAL